MSSRDYEEVTMNIFKIGVQPPENVVACGWLVFIDIWIPQFEYRVRCLWWKDELILSIIHSPTIV